MSYVMDRFVLLILSTLGMCIVAWSHTPQTQFSDSYIWSEFKIKYNKSYMNFSEEQSRFKTFCENLRFIEAYNVRIGRSELGINGLMDLTKIEFERRIILNGSKLVASRAKEILTISTFANMTTPVQLHDELPEFLDWSSDPTIVGPIQDQGDCGCCWAFAILALIEANQHKRFPATKVVTLSAQQLVDCDKLDKGCNGGMQHSALQYINKTGGVESAHDYPFISGTINNSNKTFECKFDPSKIQRSSTNLGRSWYNYSMEGNEEYLKRMLASHGPIAIMIRANDPFRFAEKSIIYDENCGPNPIPNHCLLLVGYGIDETTRREYWKVKNSWGRDWGVHGYGFLARNRNNNCGIASHPIILIDYH